MWMTVRFDFSQLFCGFVKTCSKHVVKNSMIQHTTPKLSLPLSFSLLFSALVLMNKFCSDELLKITLRKGGYK